MSDFEFHVRTEDFNAMCHELGRMTGHKFMPALEYEVARVIEKTIDLLPAASVEKIREASEASEFTTQPETLYEPQTVSGRKARERAKRRGGKLVYYLGNWYPDALWNGIVAARKAELKAKLRARGLAKRSFYAIAKALGLAVRAPGYVVKAIASTGKEYPEDATVRKTVKGDGAGIFFENAQPTVNAIGGGRALQRAIDGRVKFFNKNLEKKVFDSVAAVAKKYPGVKAG